MKLHPEHAAMLRDVAYLVEANSYEALALWREFHEHLGVPWVEEARGFWMEIGRFWRHPVVVSLHFGTVAGVRIAFYEATSRVVDHEMVEKWLAKLLPGVPRTDAMNFGHVFPPNTFRPEARSA